MADSVIIQWSARLWGVLLFLSSTAWAVDCTPDDIVLTSQAEVDAFQANHGPGCDRVVGTLVVSGADIANLDGLSGLNTLWWLEISNNPVLVDTSGLSSVTQHLGPVEIRSNAILANVAGLSGATDLVAGALIIENNPSLSDLSALAGLSHIGASLSVRDNDALANLDGLSGLTSVASNIIIQDNAGLLDASGLSGVSNFTAALDFRSNPQLASLPAISGLSQLSGLILRFNDSLTNLDELAGLTAVGNQYSELWIRDNASLTDIDGLADLISLDAGLVISGNVSLDSCSALANLLDAVDDGAPGPGPGIAGIPDVKGDVTIGPNLPGCDSVEDIVGSDPPPGSMLTYYGGLEAGDQQLVFKGSFIQDDCLDTTIPLPSQDDVLAGRVLRACARTAYQDTDTLVYDVTARRCRLFADFETSTHLDIHAVYFDDMQPGASLKMTTDAVFELEKRALLRFDPLNGELEIIESVQCAAGAETPEIIFRNGFE